MTDPHATQHPTPFRVLIAGGGVAGLEAMMALRASAGDRVAIDLLSQTDEFLYRPMSVRAPFAYGPAETYPIRRIAADFDTTVIQDGFDWVDPDRQTVGTESGKELRYDALLLALGARSFPAFDHVLTIDARRLDQSFRGLIQDLEQGYVRSVAFIAPPGPAWPLPLYELALMTARRAYDMCVQVELTIVTPEDAPLAIFGRGASNAVSALLDEAGIVVHTSSYPSVTGTALTAYPGMPPIETERRVALPKLVGPAVRGLPSRDEGFIPVTPYAQVTGVPRVFAAGDATDFAIKHGGIASQQADVAAKSIAALAGADVTLEPFRPIIRGILLTGARPRYMTAKITGGAGFSSTMSLKCPWSPPTKIAAEHLAPYLANYDRVLSAPAG
jgi:sulfide:quinone oxidoreductase